MQDMDSPKAKIKSEMQSVNLDTRERLVHKYIRGHGIEIGALHQPLPIFKHLAQVKYVDRLCIEDLRTHYPELADLPLQHVDIVDDGEKLETFQEDSVDFIVANHFLEHTQDPIGTIKRHVSVLKPGGILYMAVPDKRHTFDHLRPNTSFEHFSRDHDQGPEESYLEHVHEYVKLVDKLSGEEFHRKVEEICARNYSIHFHVWDAESLKDFITKLVIEQHQIPIEMLDFVENPSRQECICILRKKKQTMTRSFLNRLRSIYV